jgi:17 kDa outer membrane surface antigen
VTGSKARLSRQYNRCIGARLWRAIPLTAALTLGLAAGGCSLSVSHFDSLFGNGSEASDPTGTITPPPGAKSAREMPPDRDLEYTRAAVREVLRRGEKDGSQPWENPSSGARGTVTPIASAYTQDGRTCRDFLASYVSGDAETWMRGEACKQQGAWEVRSLKPWKRS